MVMPELAYQNEQFYPHGLKSMSKEHNPGGTMEKTLQRLGEVDIIPPPGPSKFVAPQTVMYHLDGRQRRWDMVKSHSSVGIVLYHAEQDALLVVRQFRPAVYASRWMEAKAEGRGPPPLSVGFTYELTAGIIDKSKSNEEIAKEEVLEEVGYDVKVENMKPVTMYVSSTGISGSKHFMFYTAVDEGMRSNGGGGLQDTGEAIEVLALPISQADSFEKDEEMPKSAGLLFGLMWLRNQKQQGLL
ncbi:g11815 [Coccomyxa viridis]|uniref:G11815 protein n=1 Tax=Coccomyxa viridis TaxID=1274662 RepID=A0ABP1GBH2_9CHLO